MSHLPPSLTTCYTRPLEPCFACIIQIYIHTGSRKESGYSSNRLSSGLPPQRGSSVQPSPLSLGHLIRSPYPISNFITDIYPSLNESFKFLWLTRASIIDSWVLSASVNIPTNFHTTLLNHTQWKLAAEVTSPLPS